MPRTPLLRALKRLFRDSQVARQRDLDLSDLRDLRAEAGQPPVGIGTGIHRPIGRRSFVAGLGAGAAALAVPRVARARRQPSIAIVGGGIAGLSCALKLADCGFASTVYEAAGRVGGRMFSNASYWDQRQVSEWCGELIDTGHVTIQALAQRFGLPLDDLHRAEPRRSQDTYKFFGRYYLPGSADADFLASVAARVSADADAAGYPTTFDSSTPAGAALDAMSIYDWIESRVPGGHRSDLGQLLELAYTIEYGADTTDQSALNLVYLLGFQPDSSQLSLFGESDETYHVRGGNQRLPAAIAEHLAQRFGCLRLGHSLQRLAATSAGRYELTFDRAGGPTTVEVADYVVLALPFAVLRGIDTRGAGFDARKQQAISELGRGRSGKTQLQFSTRLWNHRGPWPGIGNGSSYADTGYQSSWEATRAQSGSHGILVFFSGGETAASMTATRAYASADDAGVTADALTTLRRAEPVFPGLTAAWNGKATQSLPHKSPWLGASYAYWRVGQYTSFGGYEGVTLGRVLFCGEHTSQDFQGFMEGGASEGERAAADLLGLIR
jgi:monoamine oxidase